ncbi:MAG: pentapeptide repeat-containing protein [Xenococcus sp. MO_188.B8]|nr:pentapeptide repeat-containing protein [Xenococcus sp. MO_188.B8]
MTSPSNFSDQSERFDDYPQNLDKLFQSFEMIAALAEEEVRQQKIREASAAFRISEVSYRKQLKRYLCSKNHQTKEKLDAPMPNPFSFLDAKVSDFVDALKEVSLVKLATVLGESALLFAMISYIVTIPSRQQQGIQKAREILLQSSDRKYDESRVAALKMLDKRCAGNPGLVSPNAYLANLEIAGCFRWSLTPLSLAQGSFRTWQPMDLSYSDFKEANLSNAQLSGANLEGSNFSGANLQNVNLSGVNLRGANLTNADLSRANLTGANLEGAILDGANLYGAQVSQANLAKASLVETKAPWSYFDGANFYRAKLNRANFNRSDLKNADFYKANLEYATLRFTDLRGRTRLLGAKLRGADFWGARWENIFQIKRGKNWQATKLSPNWEQKVTLGMLPELRIGLIKPQEKSSLFKAYELGMRRAANRRVDIWGFESKGGVMEEAATIDNMIELGMDAIILRPSDPVNSLPAMKKASEAGLVIITVDSCLEREIAEDVASACFDTNSEKMGYDSGVYLTQWAKQNLISRQAPKSKPINIALVDGATYDRNYPYLQGILAAMDKSDLSWKTVASVGVAHHYDGDKVAEILEAAPEIKILWGGSNLATKVAVETVERLDLEDQVKVFGILDLSREQAERLLDSTNPLQSIIDQSGVQTGKQATQRAIAVLRGEVAGEVYEENIVDHRLLTQDDTEQVRKLLNEAGSL